MTDISERSHQELVIEWISKQHTWLLEYTICIRNEAKCSAHVGKRLNAQGRLKGASDLFFARPTTKYYGLFLEMKSLTGRLTKEQKAFLDRMNKIGYCGLKANGFDEAITIITDYLNNKI